MGLQMKCYERGIDAMPLWLLFSPPDLKIWILNVYEASKSEAAGKFHARLDNQHPRREAICKGGGIFLDPPRKEGERKQWLFFNHLNLII